MSTPQLYDENEENWPVKLHLGCGGVYLSGYTNIDVRGEMADALSAQALEAHSTGIDDYYSRSGTWDHLPERGRIVIDQKVDFRDLRKAYAPGTVDKIVAVQSFEHLDSIDFLEVILDCYEMLRSPGVLIVSVPDMAMTLDWMRDPERVEFAIRHLQGSLVDKWSRHKSWWTTETLQKAFEYFGFILVESVENFHVYPAVVKKGWKIEG